MPRLLVLCLMMFAMSVGHGVTLAQTTDVQILKTEQNWPNREQWPYTDFSRYSVNAEDITSGGPPRDGIPAIDNPQFKSIAEVDYDPREPVIALEINGEAKAYPMSVLIWHEIANDTLGGVPVTVTFCPLCNSAIVYDRRVDGKETTFGVSGLLRNSDMIMYDRHTHSWWQQFNGQGIVGTHMGESLKRIPARFVSYRQFVNRYPKGKVLVPTNPKARRYGCNPYVDYDRTGRPFNVFVKVPKGFRRMERVVVVGDTAWRMRSLAKAKTLEQDGLRFSWQKGQASALDDAKISRGRDVGSIIVERQDADGTWHLVNYDVVFAFVFAAFKPDGDWRG
jgi:hypothetical protein